MKKKKEWYLHYGAKLWLISCHSSYFSSMIQSMTGVLTRPWFPPSPNPLGAHFPAQRLTIESNKTLALAKTCLCLCLGQIVILVLACVHTTPQPLGEGAPSPIFPKGSGGGGSVHRLFSVCALGRLSFQFRIPTKPLLSLKWVHSVIDFATLRQVTAG